LSVVLGNTDNWMKVDLHGFFNCSGYKKNGNSENILTQNPPLEGRDDWIQIDLHRFFPLF